MPSPLQAILLSAIWIAKQNLISRIVCPQCGERRCLIKWGFYRRYLFAGDDTVMIQRIGCLNRRCPRRTFSVLPHPLLPVLRVPLCFLLTLLTMHQRGCTIAQLVRKSGKSWPVVRRCLAAAGRVQTFLQKEAATILGTASPCLQAAACWTAFTRALSWALFPKRFCKLPPT
jgi:hypothetical protein